MTDFSTEEINILRNETKGCREVIHLNNAGASLMPDQVTDAIIEHIRLEGAVGGYEAAELKAAKIKEFYQAAGTLLHCSASNVAFTANATDSFSRALSSVPFKPGDIILTSNDDYISNQIMYLSFQKRFGIKLHRVKNDPAGGVDLHDLDHQLKKLHPRLLAVTHIPTNSGLVQPVKEIGEIVSR